jgi:nucleotide-binding universal stress UspA family protein
MAHLLLGSVAEKVASTAPCPVLTMREAPPATDGQGLRILVPTDFSAPADAALGCAERLAARTGGSVCLLHVLEHTAVSAGPGSELVPEPPETTAERSAKAKVELARRRMLVNSRSRVKIDGEIGNRKVCAF